MVGLCVYSEWLDGVYAVSGLMVDIKRVVGLNVSGWMVYIVSESTTRKCCTACDRVTLSYTWAIVKSMRHGWLRDS